MSKELLITEVADFIGRVDKLRSIFPAQQKELFALWKRVYNETIYCTSCDKVTANVYSRLKTWYNENKQAISEPVEIEMPEKKDVKRNTSKKNK